MYEASLYDIVSVPFVSLSSSKHFQLILVKDHQSLVC
jgi:hypothetical protein